MVERQPEGSAGREAGRPTALAHRLCCIVGALRWALARVPPPSPDPPHPLPAQDYAGVSLLAMGGAYFTNWALNYLNYTTRIVFKSCRVLPVMAFRRWEEQEGQAAG